MAQSNLPDRFWSKVERTPTCWNWTGATNGVGYGQLHFRIDGRQKQRYAHRLAYEALVGPIPAGLDLDHLCRNRACVNPAHLEPVTRGVNLARGEGTAKRRRQTHCKRGHRFDDVNTVVIVKRSGNKSRGCRTCRAGYPR